MSSSSSSSGSGVRHQAAVRPSVRRHSFIAVSSSSSARRAVVRLSSSSSSSSSTTGIFVIVLMQQQFIIQLDWFFIHRQRTAVPRRQVRNRHRARQFILDSSSSSSPSLSRADLHPANSCSCVVSNGVNPVFRPVDMAAPGVGSRGTRNGHVLSAVTTISSLTARMPVRGMAGRCRHLPTVKASGGPGADVMFQNTSGNVEYMKAGTTIGQLQCALRQSQHSVEEHDHE